MIHPKALVHSDCDVDPTASVWQFASIIRGAKVGARTVVAAYAIIDASVVGEQCIISHGAFVDPGVRIGSSVFVGPHVCFCNDNWPRVDKVGFEYDLLKRGELVTVVVKDGASLGAGSIILPGVTIGSCAMVAAGAVVDRDVPAHVLFTRDGAMRPIEPERIRRTVAASSSLPVAAE